MNPKEVLRVEKYLRERFKLGAIALRRRAATDDSVEVYIGEEFIGVLFRDDEDGEVSYQFQMAILAMDLPPER